jgi:hypothetical protein
MINLYSSFTVVCSLTSTYRRYISHSRSFFFFGSVGGAIGSIVTSTIWQNVFPKRLAVYLPAEEVSNLLMMFADIDT